MLNRQELLEDLERRARRVLPVAKAKSLVAEAEAHLDATIQARLELDDHPEAAERDAVAAFGNPKEIVGRLAAIDRTRFQPFFLFCTTASGLGAAFAVLASPVLGGHLVTMAWIAFTATWIGFVRASEARRPWMPVFLATGAFWFFFSAICAAWMRDFTFEGWASPRPTGPIDLPHAAQWGAGGAAVFLGYLVLAYRMTRPAPPKRSDA